jgi:predicted ATPase
MVNYRYVLTGAPGSGKTAMLREFAEAGYEGVPEPARIVLAEERAVGGTGVPETDPARFCSLLLTKAVASYEQAAGSIVPIFFDRGVPDVIGYARWLGVDASTAEAASASCRYNDIVFVLSAWESIYLTDDERKMPFEAARAFGEVLRTVYEELGYELVDVPEDTPLARVKFVLSVVSDR